MKNLITSGELAKLANTTKRTILFYDKKGVLKPKQINDQNYRFYSQDQILDYQKILLLTTLGISLGEIKKYLDKKGNISQLFNDKKELIEKEIKLQKFNLNNLNSYQTNIKNNKTMIDPKIKTIKNLEIYYIEKLGSYSKIGQFCQELIEMFDRGNNFTTLAIFKDQGYRPQKSQMRIGVIKKKEMRIKKECIDVVKSLIFNPGKCLTYTHNGSGNLLSIFWKELERYARLNKIKIRKDTPDFEIYRQVNLDTTKQFFEIYLPVE
ncbi:MAG: MerR family transcriptional regulator [Candidatus Beckwithbacteria bacterium]|nr:MerR family transcriptional regulator [Patescibacteria group bacterium]